MDWCSVYLAPQGLPKYIYLSPPLTFPTTYNGIRTKNRPVWFTPGAAPIRWMWPIRNPRWKQKRTEGYVIVSSVLVVSNFSFSTIFLIDFGTVLIVWHFFVFDYLMNFREYRRGNHKCRIQRNWQYMVHKTTKTINKYTTHYVLDTTISKQIQIT